MKRALVLTAFMLTGVTLIASCKTDTIRDNRSKETLLNYNSETKDTELYSRIKQAAEQKLSDPINARVDRVWGAIPGYDGLEVDIKASYLKTISTPNRKDIQYVYHTKKPTVQLEHLGAHPIYRANPAKPMVALMINVAWGNEHLLPMLDTLDKANVKATFFLDGSWLSKHTSLALEIKKRKHELANHAYTHPKISQLSRERVIIEIQKTNDLLEKIGVRNRWFAPPSGDFNQRAVQIAHELGLHTVLWTVDTVDWRNPSPQSIIQKMNRLVEPGTLILMHPTQSSKQALAGIIDTIREKKLTLGTVTEVLSSERVETLY